MNPSDQRLNEIISVFERALDGELQALVGDDLSDVYQVLLFARQCLEENRKRAQDLKDIYGPNGM